MSRPCEQCHAVKQCRMVLDRSVAPPLIVYLCRPCARELGYPTGAIRPIQEAQS